MLPYLHYLLCQLTYANKGVFPDTLEHIVDVAVRCSEFEVVAILGPEHGFRGEHQAEIGDPIMHIDNSTNLPVYSAYKMSVAEIDALLIEKNVTAILVDMQDVGVRLYTFIWTMYNVMQAVGIATVRRGESIHVVVCDRPNPMGGCLVDGPLLDMSQCMSGYGRAPITHIHGMTIGELSLFFNSQLSPAVVELHVIKLRGYHRNMSWGDTGLPWIPPSPNVMYIFYFLTGVPCFLIIFKVLGGRS